MSRSRIEDLLQSHRFWLIDILPSSTVPFFVLGSPSYAFASITAPEITLDVEEIKQLNSMFRRSVYSGGAVGPITLTRGCRPWDDSFYQWIRKAIEGEDTIHRTLLLIHYTGVGSDDERYNDIASGILSGGVTAVASGLGLDFGPGQILNLPGRAWVLWNCLPIRYKTGSDFDAKSAEVSLMELEIQPYAIKEFVLGIAGSALAQARSSKNRSGSGDRTGNTSATTSGRVL